MVDIALFMILPYVAVAIELSVSLYRYFSGSYQFSSLSSEFLEGRELFWGSTCWHFGILAVILGHVIGFAFPREVMLFGGTSARLLILEVGALIFGLMALTGILLLIKRRLTHPRIQAVTSPMDLIVLGILFVQVASGVWIAMQYRWGSLWYAAALVPYLRSLFTLRPIVENVASMPWVVKLHMVTTFLIIGILPFTRLLHFLVVPIPYLWRSWQIVVWNWDRKRIRKPG